MQKKTPNCFLHFRDLDTWTAYGQLMKAIYATFNNDRPYVNPKICHPDIKKRLTKDEILAHFNDQQKETEIHFHLQERNDGYSFFFRGRIVGMHAATPTGLLLTLDGAVYRELLVGQVDVPVVMTCFYETGDYGCNCYGFALLPVLAINKLGCSRY